MRRYGKRSLTLAALLAGLAGYVDAIGFLQLGGFFVSFMSGNSTRLAVEAAGANAEAAFTAGALIGLFVVGVIAGVQLGREGWRWRRLAVLSMTGAALALAASLAGLGLGRPAMACCALGMGALNALFQRDGDIGIGVTYMTGALVRMGQRIAHAMRGGPTWDFAPFALLWLSLTCGAAAGAWAFGEVGGSGLWPAAGGALALAAILGWRDRRIG